VSRSAPVGPGRRSRPVKRRKPRGLGKGRVPTATTRYVEPMAVAQEPMTAMERAHALASLNRRLPLS
jgi:hypothetical protein